MVIPITVVGYILVGFVPGEDTGITNHKDKFAPLLLGAPLYECPSWMDEEICCLLTDTCGNDVCDEHENCNTCKFDCGCIGGQSCLPNGKCLPSEYDRPVLDDD